jgi:Do/DeqQ family serine protease
MDSRQKNLLYFSLLCVLFVLLIVYLNPYKKEDGLLVHRGIATNSHLQSDTKTDFGDFVYAAKVGAPAVVHIKSKVAVSRSPTDVPFPFRDFFNDDFWDRFFEAPDAQQQQQNFAEASGSGVIIDAEGFIVTNNHVIEDASSIEVVLHDQRAYDGELVGTDPLTDLALIKIDEDELPFLKFGDSDQTQVGEWVLAVGNPFYNLSSTVTAGIISAKARNINILHDQAAIESFIQTDAAVNRGNSGGALMTIQGELIGINTAIASPTGVYAGYAFAIPSNIVKKVVDDLMTFGEVKRAHLGVMVRNLDSELLKKFDLKQSNGVLVDSLIPNGAAQRSGIVAGDIIMKIDDQEVLSVARLQAIIGTLRPDDNILVTLQREKKLLEIPVKLQSLKSTMRGSETDGAIFIEQLGAEFRDLTRSELRELGIKGGVRLHKLHDGKLSRNTSIREGFVILEIDRKEVNSVEELIGILGTLEGGVLLEGIYPGRQGRFYYAFGM